MGSCNGQIGHTLIERLRATCDDGCEPDLIYEAADEIERLSKRVAELIECQKTCAELAYIEGQAEERERCAKLCESMREEDRPSDYAWTIRTDWADEPQSAVAAAFGNINGLPGA